MVKLNFYCWEYVLIFIVTQTMIKRLKDSERTKLF